MDKQKEILIYTDGACFGNPGPGGYGAILIYGDHRKEISGGFRLTTNNRMEILAPIMAIKALKPGQKYKIRIYTDSRLVVDSIMKGWARKWRANGWMRTKKDQALNADLWAELLDQIDKHDVEIRWVEGHAGQPENERCDVISKQAAEHPNLPTDVNYERSKANETKQNLLNQ